MKTPQKQWLLFFLGVAILPALIFGHRYVPNSDSVVQFGGLILVLASLPFVFFKLKGQAVPAKKSDLLGYVVIIAFCAAVIFVARAVLT